MLFIYIIFKYLWNQEELSYYQKFSTNVDVQCY